jgi:hypothetical protein
MPQNQLRHALVAVLLLVAMLCQGTWALASTTGGMNGSVLDADSNAAIANASVTASSPSQTISTTTDASGRFTFISLTPDTYTVSVTKDGYQPASTAGVTVFADAVQSVSLRLISALKTIAHVSSTATESLVKRGTTADVYAIGAAQQDKLNGLGGGGSLNSAYSAIASVPGAFVPLNQAGYFQTVHIRGGDYDQVGYELDGVPVNRSFDNYPSGSASSLGQQEVQVYTGATPANSEGEGLAGYINQIIKTGTYPGFGQLALGIGDPTYYHKASLEVGGANADRTFSYYFGIGGYNQDFRYVNNSNAAGYTNVAPPLAPLSDPAGCTSPFTGYSSCYASGVGPGGYALLPYQYGLESTIADRDVVANFHIALKHKSDGGRDDIQLLWDSGYLNNGTYTSTNDAGGAAYLNGTGFGAPIYLDSYQWNCPIGPTATLNSGCVSYYNSPSSPTGRAVESAISPDARDTITNDQEVVKLQYQKNIGTDAFFRVYGYTYYSDWLQNGPQCSYADYICGASPDYELSSHTRGVSAEFSSQFNAQNLISAQASYTTASVIRDNNTQSFNFTGIRSDAAVAVNANTPYSGLCYNAASLAVTCAPGSHPAADWATWGDIGGFGLAGGTVPALPASCGGPCTWLVAENSQWATYNTVTPIFTALSLTDEFRPNDRLLLSLGVREDGFKFQGADTRAGDPVRAFWYTAWNMDNCLLATTGAPSSKVSLGLGPTAACPAGYTAGDLVNTSAQVLDYNVFQPRFSGTYTFNPDTVVRFSAGKYVEPPNTAFEQYDTLEEDSPFALLGTAFSKFGFTTPGHAVLPPTSNNYDFSLEKHIRGTDWSFKLTPFLRKTQNQIQQFYLDQATSFVSGLNVGRQTSEGVEFQLQKGDFSKNGLSGQLSFAYTNSFINYNTLNNGTTIVSGMNGDIGKYNGYTKNCAAGGSSVGVISGGQYVCGAAGASANAAPCFSPAGTPDAVCAGGDIGNPYYNGNIQALLSPSANYPTYDLFPGPIGSAAQAYGAPFVASLVLNYKHDRLAITPSLQFVGGERYGAPETTPGIDPAGGCAALPFGAQTGDPRYPYGNPGPNSYDATSCGSTLTIPNQYTGTFDNLGSFLQPNQIMGNLQVSYEASSKVTLVGTFANLLNRCFGGTKAPWTSTDPNVCSYGTLPTGGAFGPVGNVYNWSTTQQSPIQALVKYPYGSYLAGTNDDGNSTKTPFNFYLEARIKI